MRIVPLGLLLATMTGACARSSGTGPSDPANALIDEHVRFEEIEGATSYLSGIRDRRRLVIEDREGWLTFWEELNALVTPMPEPPAVDFATKLVIAASMGERATGGYSIRIDDISTDGELTRVVVVETAPGPACLTTQSFSAPATAVTVSRPIGDVEFVEQTEMNDC